jgi:Flp pilus assembly protein CpaB
MRASSLFGLTLAALLGLGAVLVAKYRGYFDEEVTPETKEAVYKVLVAKRPLFKGVVLSSNDVEVRTLVNGERAYYEKYKKDDKLLPPLVHAVDYRVLVKNVGAGQILIEDYFEPTAFPDGVSERLEPGMSSVHLTLPRDRAAGGVLRVGEYVDVLLTTAITPPNKGKPFAASARIARGLKIVVKRDNLWTVMKADSESKPALFTLQANPYRAALVEYSKLKGLITLVPAASTMLARDEREPMNDPDSREYRDEEKRISEYLNNERSVNDLDLERIFNLRATMMQTAEPPPIAVEIMTGTKFREPVIFGSGPRGAKETPKGAANAQKQGPVTTVEDTAGFLFSSPDPRAVQAMMSGKDCPTCKK